MHEGSTNKVDKVHSNLKSPKDLRQGCSLSLTIFNLKVEYVIELWKRNSEIVNISKRKKQINMSRISFVGD